MVGDLMPQGQTDAALELGFARAGRFQIALIEQDARRQVAAGIRTHHVLAAEARIETEQGLRPLEASRFGAGQGPHVDLKVIEQTPDVVGQFRQTGLGQLVEPLRVSFTARFYTIAARAALWYRRGMTQLPAKDWDTVEPFPFSAARKSFRGPTSNKDLLSMSYYRRPDGSMVAVAAFGPLSEGAPGQVHGGMVLTELDEALGAAAWLAGHPVLTVRLETEFRAAVPVSAHLLVETRILSTRHRLIVVEGSLLGEGGKVYARAKGRFLELGAAAHERIFGKKRA